jgi:hypothetical protein
MNVTIVIALDMAQLPTSYNSFSVSFPHGKVHIQAKFRRNRSSTEIFLFHSSDIREKIEVLAEAYLVETLRYTPEGRGFYSRLA